MLKKTEPREPKLFPVEEGPYPSLFRGLFHRRQAMTFLVREPTSAKRWRVRVLWLGAEADGHYQVVGLLIGVDREQCREPLAVSGWYNPNTRKGEIKLD